MDCPEKLIIDHIGADIVTIKKLLKSKLKILNFQKNETLFAPLLFLHKYNIFLILKIMSTTKPFTIVIGNKRYSSWSMRPWLGLRFVAGKDGFQEILCNLAGEGNVEDGIMPYSKIKEVSPIEKVPVLIDEELNVSIHESIAILMHLALRFPESGLLPENPADRAICLSVSSEMHSGFMGIRTNFPVHTLGIGRKHGVEALKLPEVQADIRRIGTMWTELRTQHAAKGPFLFGHFTIADCMYAPVLFRFRAYDPDYTSLQAYPLAIAYIESLYQLDMIQEWIDGARKEKAYTFLQRYEKFLDDESSSAL